MKITIQTSAGSHCELKVGTTHHPYTGALPQVGQVLIVPDDAVVEEEARGEAKVVRIVWHYNAISSALWPEIVCSSTRRHAERSL